LEVAGLGNRPRFAPDSVLFIAARDVANVRVGIKRQPRIEHHFVGVEEVVLMANAFIRLSRIAGDDFRYLLCGDLSGQLAAECRRKSFGCYFGRRHNVFS
jgi:hypothetical protein